MGAISIVYVGNTPSSMGRTPPHKSKELSPVHVAVAALALAVSQDATQLLRAAAAWRRSGRRRQGSSMVSRVIQWGFSGIFHYEFIGFNEI